MNGNATDLEVAGCTAVAIIVIFLIAAWVQRRAVPTQPELRRPAGGIAGPAVEWTGVFDGRLVALEGWAKKADHDLNNIRQALPALPSKDTVHSLEIRVAELAGNVHATEATLALLARSVGRIENHLMGPTNQ